MSHRETGEKLEVVYGIHAVMEAVRTRTIDHVLVTQGQHNPRVQEIIDACRATGISLRFAPRPAVERAAGDTQHQNVVAVSELFWNNPRGPCSLSWMGWKTPPTWGPSSARRWPPVQTEL
jgi:tRNA G18 (ribose-2'-O)-methylase SpoU